MDTLVIEVIIEERGGVGRRETFALLDAGEITIGRVRGNDIVLPRCNVSKRQCSIMRRGGALFVRDTRSACGTYVNDRKITGPRELGPKDRLQIGDHVLRVRPSSGSEPAGAPAALPAEIAPAILAEAERVDRTGYRPPRSISSGPTRTRSRSRRGRPERSCGSRRASGCPCAWGSDPR